MVKVPQIVPQMGGFLGVKMRKNKRKFVKKRHFFDIGISGQNLGISWHRLVFKEI